MTLARLCQALGLGADPDAVIRRIDGLYLELDAELEAGRAGLELPCRAGCAACCHESVFLSAPEFLRVAAAIAGWPAVDRRRLVREMSELAERFEDELEMLDELPKGPERDEVAARVKFRCPLLGPDDRCRVYAARELNARTFGQSWDGERDHPYGCELTHARLRLVPPPPSLPDARAARRRLRDLYPDHVRVQPYPYWFRAFGGFLLESER